MLLLSSPEQNASDNTIIIGMIAINLMSAFTVHYDIGKFFVYSA